MKAVTFKGIRIVEVKEVADPKIMKDDEAMGIVEETGKGITKIKKGDRVIVPFPVACGPVGLLTQKRAAFMVAKRNCLCCGSIWSKI